MYTDILHIYIKILHIVGNTLKTIFNITNYTSYGIDNTDIYNI